MWDLQKVFMDTSGISLYPSGFGGQQLLTILNFGDACGLIIFAGPKKKKKNVRN